MLDSWQFILPFTMAYLWAYVRGFRDNFTLESSSRNIGFLWSVRFVVLIHIFSKPRSDLLDVIQLNNTSFLALLHEVINVLSCVCTISFEAIVCLWKDVKLEPNAQQKNNWKRHTAAVKSLPCHENIFQPVCVDKYWRLCLFIMSILKVCFKLCVIDT